MTRLSLLVIPTALAVASLCFAAEPQPLGAFSYESTEVAREEWVPQFDSQPVRVEQLDDGSTCLALDASFRERMDRVTWDWEHALDLSDVGYVSFEVSATRPEVAGTVGFYFGTENGWYARFLGSLSEQWRKITLRLDTFGEEGAPDGWDQIQHMRFAVWASGPGDAVFRLRNLQAIPRDPYENFLKNGSFEIPGVGVPYAWGSGHWGVGHLPWVADMDLWREHFFLDRSVAHHGESSLCIDNTADLPLLRAVSVWVTPPDSAESCVLSAWLRADREDLPVILRGGGEQAQVEVGESWSQHALPGLEPATRMTMSIEPQAPGRLWIDAVQLQGTQGPSAAFHPCLSDERIAQREAEVDWSPPPRVEEIAAGRATTGPVEALPAAIDEHGRFLLGGEPYIQHSLGLEFISDLDVLDAVAANGFQDVTVQIREYVSTQRLQEIFDRCAELGLRIIPWLDRRIPRETLRQHIQTLRDHPALLVWYVYDEPSGEGFEEAEARLEMAGELDPGRPAFINYLSNKLEDHAGDIYSTDVYPIPHATPMSAIGAVRRMHEGASAEAKPVWMWLQGTGYAYWMDREPSPRELSCMVYGSLIEGARGLYYFAQFPRTRQCLDEMRALLVEVDALEPWLTSLQEAPAAEVDDANVLTAAYRRGDELCVLAVNTLPEPREVRLSVPDANGAIAVMFEGRSLTPEGGAWTDHFGPYERHVYRLTE
ncbi:MAG: hypothetical protein ACP5KN_09015 [Armatimonadota bacterium]